MTELKPCPFCGGEEIEVRAFSLSPDCSVECKVCGAGFANDVPWGDMDEKEHDEACFEALSELWNRRAE